VDLERHDYNYFINSFDQKTVPFKIRVTASNNQVIEDEIVAIVPETTQQSSKQFGNPIEPQPSGGNTEPQLSGEHNPSDSRKFEASSSIAGGVMVSVVLVVIAICAQLVLM
jgi:hypothetical protein